MNSSSGTRSESRFAINANQLRELPSTRDKQDYRPSCTASEQSYGNIQHEHYCPTALLRNKKEQEAVQQELALSCAQLSTTVHLRIEDEAVADPEVGLRQPSPPQHMYPHSGE